MENTILELLSMKSMVADMCIKFLICVFKQEAQGMLYENNKINQFKPFKQL